MGCDFGMVRAEPATGSRASPNVDYGPPKTLYNRWVRWSRLGVFARIFTQLAAEGRERETLMIDSTHLKAHRTAASLRGKKGGPNGSSGAPRAG